MKLSGAGRLRVPGRIKAPPVWASPSEIMGADFLVRRGAAGVCLMSGLCGVRKTLPHTGRLQWTSSLSPYPLGHDNTKYINSLSGNLLNKDGPSGEHTPNPVSGNDLLSRTDVGEFCIHISMFWNIVSTVGRSSHYWSALQK